MSSVDFAEVEGCRSKGQWDRAGGLLAIEAARLEAAGAELLVLCTNTMHKVADAIEDAVGDSTAAPRRFDRGRCPRTRVWTPWVCSALPSRCRRTSTAAGSSHTGRGCWCPTRTTSGLVHRVIYDEPAKAWCAKSRVRRTSRSSSAWSPRRPRRHPGLHRDRDADRAGDLHVPVFPTTSIHISAAVERRSTERGQRED